MSLLLVSVVAFVLGFVGSIPLAGPISVVVVSRCAQARYAEARRVAVGAAVAEGAYAFLAFFGFATILAEHDWVLPVSHGVTAAVLLALGIHFLRWRAPEAGSEKPSAHRSPLLLGFWLSALNPTLLLTWSAVTTALYSRQLVPVRGIFALPFGLAAGSGIAAWFAILVAILRRFESRVPTRAVTWVVRAMGLSLVVVAVWSGADGLRAMSGARPGAF